MDTSFKSGRNQAIATVILLGISAFFLVAESAGWYFVGNLWHNDPSARLTAAGVVGLMELVSVMLLIATAVVFSTWVYRAMSNLPALGSMSARFTPAGAVWAFFIPFVNLVRGHQVMATIWTESQPMPVNDNGFMKPRSVGIVNAWWALWIGGNVLEWVLSHALDDVGSLAYNEAFFKLVRAGAALLCLLMVQRADARQHAQADDLSRRASVPQPTGMELR
jgi:hypothetical protein